MTFPNPLFFLSLCPWFHLVFPFFIPGFSLVFPWFFPCFQHQFMLFLCWFYDKFSLDNPMFFPCSYISKTLHYPLFFLSCITGKTNVGDGSVIINSSNNLLIPSFKQRIQRKKTRVSARRDCNIWTRITYTRIIIPNCYQDESKKSFSPISQPIKAQIGHHAWSFKRLFIFA